MGHRSTMIAQLDIRTPPEAAEHVLEWGGTGVRGHLTYKKKIIAPLGTPSWYIVGLACTPVLVGHFIFWGEIFLLPLWALLPDTL